MKTHHKRLVLFTALLLAFGTPYLVARDKPAPPPTVAVLFSPHGGCTDRIVAEIGKAKRTIRIQAYSFTSAPIAKAIVDAHKRGLKIEACLDKSNRSDKYSSATFLKNQGIDVFIDDKHAIAHSKVMIIDDATLITGSFNFSKAAEESNLENLLIIKNDAEVVRKYNENWQAHRKHCTPYEGVAGPKPGSPELRKPRAAASQPAGATTVYATRNGKKYHMAGCRYLQGGGTAMTIAEAKASGRTACKACRAPE